MKKYSLLLSLCAVLCSCGQHHVSKPQINPEILGVWQDSAGCKLELAIGSNHNLLLTKLSNAQNLHLTNVPLKWSKQSVFTIFKSTESGIDFSGSFSDGLMTIDNKVCLQILHKADNN